MLFIIPTWNTIIKIAESCCNACPCTRKNEPSQFKDNCWNYCEVCKWLLILIYELGFWGLFLAILFLISRFLLDSINLENKTFQLVIYYITIAAFSGILLWLNTDLVTYPKDSKENRDEHQQTSEENQDKRYQENEDMF